MQTANYWERSAPVNTQEFDKKNHNKSRSATNEEKYIFYMFK